MLNFDDPTTYLLLLEVSKHYAVDPSMSIEAEDFFRKLLTQYAGKPNPTSITTWLEEQIPQYFAVIGERPRWIQSPQWPFEEGNPMIFVDQIDLSPQSKKIISTIYHDDTSLYIFIGQKVQPVVIVQQF